MARTVPLSNICLEEFEAGLILNDGQGDPGPPPANEAGALQKLWMTKETAPRAVSFVFYHPTLSGTNVLARTLAPLTHQLQNCHRV